MSAVAKPVAIFRFSETENPGHFATFLDANRVPWTLVALDAGEAVPASCAPFAGVGFMGGPMSANDELPWTRPVLDFMRSAVAAGTPVIGHCLGAQLLARALGGRVAANPVREIGWGTVTVEDSATARAWFGADLREFSAFHWHGEAFTLPPGAERILRGAWCDNQAYVVDARHLGMQCHVEMTAEMIASWLASGAREIRDHRASPAVQAAPAIEVEAPRRLTALGAVADRLYAAWIRNLKG
jgi:GMP synthase-like glutamine amidotransferase